MSLDKSVKKFDSLYMRESTCSEADEGGVKHTCEGHALNMFVVCTNTEVRNIHLKQSLGRDSDQTSSGGKKLQGNMMT